MKSNLADVHVDNDVENVAFGYWNCQICDFKSVTSDVYKSHVSDEHVHKSDSKHIFGPNCQICVLGSMTSGILKSHLACVHVLNGFKAKLFVNRDREECQICDLI